MNAPVQISTSEWVELLLDSEVTNAQQLNILKIVYESENHEISAPAIAKKLKLPHHGGVNRQIVVFSQRVVKKTKIQPPLRGDGSIRWWHIPFLSYNNKGKFPWIMRPELAIAMKTVLNQETSDYGEIAEEDFLPLLEEARSRVYVNRYERNEIAKKICIAHHGASCVICGFNFEKVYGPIGSNKIHVHHLMPLSKIGEEYKVDPIEDLRPVCPNCHFMIHSRKEPLSLEEMEKLLNITVK